MDVASFIGHPLDKEAIQRVIQAASIESMRTSFAKDKEETLKGNNNKNLDPTIFVNKGTICFSMMVLHVPGKKVILTTVY